MNVRRAPDALREVGELMSLRSPQFAGPLPPYFSWLQAFCARMAANMGTSAPLKHVQNSMVRSGQEARNTF